MDKKLLQDFCDMRCTFEELQEIVEAFREIRFHDKAYDQYFNVDCIVHAIEKYQANEIDSKYLDAWTAAYSSIIETGTEIKDEKLSLKEFLLWEITDWLDSSFHRCDRNDPSLENCKVTFQTLGRILKDLDDCTAVCYEKVVGGDEEEKHLDDIYWCEEGYFIVLITNDKSRYFTKIEEYTNTIGRDLLLPRISSEEEISSQIAKLQKQGYTELAY